MSDVIKEFHDNHIHFPSGTMYIDSEVDAVSAAHVIKNIHMLDRAGKDIRLIINHPSL